MSSRDHRRRDRSWEERDKSRYSRNARGGGYGGDRGGGYRDEPRRKASRSRSRSPPRRGDRERRGGPDRRDYNRDDVRDDWDRRSSRRDDRDNGHGRDLERDRDRDATKDRPRREGEQSSSQNPDIREQDGKLPTPVKPSDPREQPLRPEAPSSTSHLQPKPTNFASHPEEGEEDGEAMEATFDDDAAMMAMMGLSGFGTTKGKQVAGNQEGGVNVKKMRTWRQYMNRRGGFNRPLDKIK